MLKKCIASQSLGEKKEEWGKKEVDGVRAKVGLTLVNLLPFPLLSSRKSVGTG